MLHALFPCKECDLWHCRCQLDTIRCETRAAVFPQSGKVGSSGMRVSVYLVASNSCPWGKIMVSVMRQSRESAARVGMEDPQGSRHI